MTASESPSKVDRIEELEVSTILMDSPDAQAMNEPSDETAKAPPE